MIATINSGCPFIALSRYNEQHGENVTINLTADAESILQWAREKMIEEFRIKELAKTNISVADAVGALKQAEEQLKVVIELTK